MALATLDLFQENLDFLGAGALFLCTLGFLAKVPEKGRKKYLPATRNKGDPCRREGCLKAQWGVGAKVKRKHP